MWTVISAVICSIFIIAALLGTVLPVLPGLPLAWAGILIYAAVTGFERISLTTTLVLLFVTIAAMAVGYFAPVLGAKKIKASRWGVFGAFVGLTVGILTIGFWGIIIGPFLGALIGELIAQKPPGTALKSAFGTFVGFLSGTLLEIIVILVMAGFFIVSLF